MHINLQQCLHTEYISLIGAIFARLYFLGVFLDKGLLSTRKLFNQEFQMAKLKSCLRIFYGRHYEVGWSLWRNGLTNDIEYVSYVVNTIPFCFPEYDLQNKTISRICNSMSNTTGATCAADLRILPEHLWLSVVGGGGVVLLSLLFSMLFLVYYYLSVCLVHFNHGVVSLFSIEILTVISRPYSFTG